MVRATCLILAPSVATAVDGGPRCFCPRPGSSRHRLDHCYDSGFHRLGQRRPGHQDGLQIGDNFVDSCTNCPGFCTVGFRNGRLSRGMADWFESRLGYLREVSHALAEDRPSPQSVVAWAFSLAPPAGCFGRTVCQVISDVSHLACCSFSGLRCLIARERPSMDILYVAAARFARRQRVEFDGRQSGYD